VNLLKSVPLLAKLTDKEKQQLAACLTVKHYKDGKNIVVQGDEGHGFYIIKEGNVVVEAMQGDSKKATELGRLKKGDFFGETALITSSRRGATVRALGDVKCFYLDRKSFHSLFGKDRLNIQFAKRKAISAEQTSSTYTPQIPQNAVKKKTAEVRKLILGAVKFNVMFMGLDLEHQQKIVDQMYRTEVKKGTSIIKQGDLGDNLYVVEEGQFQVFVNSVQVALRGEGTCFGELALMYNSPRAATVIASQDAVVWVVDRFTFRRIVTDLSSQSFYQYVSFLKKVDLLAPLAEYEREKIAEALEEVEFKKGSTVFKQGEDGDAMFIVQKGEVHVMKKGKKDTDEVPKHVNTCKKGDYFGERALMKGEPRAATILCVSDIKCLRLDRNAFSLLLGPLEEIMNQKCASYDQKAPTEEKKVVATKRKIEFTDLVVVGTLGKGSFGHVQLVKEKGQKFTYALKAVSKAQIVQTGQQGHIMSEKRVMEMLDHPFLVKLYATYKDRDRLYFLLEPSLGGELFSVLREKTLFDDDTARFYAGSVVLAFEYMHSKNIVYRDLKPENLLLDQDGYLKVTDFGFAKDISAGRTWTLCGTPDYLAPEIVAGKGHGKGVDWWTLGVFIYEMLASYPPFYDEDPMKTYAKIMHGSITFPSHFSKEAVSIVKKLLHHKHTKRLGVVKGGARLIKKHTWFKKFEWTKLIKRDLKPSIIPKIKDQYDLTNFDDYPDDEEDVPSYIDDGSGWDDDF